jgi:hypothetical protein
MFSETSPPPRRERLSGHATRVGLRRVMPRGSSAGRIGHVAPSGGNRQPWFFIAAPNGAPALGRGSPRPAAVQRLEAARITAWGSAPQHALPPPADHLRPVLLFIAGWTRRGGANQPFPAVRTCCRSSGSRRLAHLTTHDVRQRGRRMARPTRELSDLCDAADRVASRPLRPSAPTLDRYLLVLRALRAAAEDSARGRSFVKPSGTCDCTSQRRSSVEVKNVLQK